MSEDEDTLPIQSHANIDLVTFDSLNAYNVKNYMHSANQR